MRKKTLGIILIIISGLNMFGWVIKSASGESIGSPMYIILTLMIFAGGVSLTMSKKKQSNNTDLKKRDE